MTEIDLDECLNCTLPMHVCCGIPKQCRARYAKYLEKKAEAERKKNQPRTRVRGKVNQNEKTV